jgi:hypothetical protein
MELKTELHDTPQNQLLQKAVKYSDHK